MKIGQGMHPVDEVLGDMGLCERYSLPESLIPELRTLGQTETNLELEDVKKTVITKSRRLLETLS